MIKIRTAALFSIFLFLSVKNFSQIRTMRTEPQARQLIDSIYKKLTEGADFALMANTLSEDPGTNKKGGKYSKCKVGSFTPEFEEVVLGLKTNEISKPFKTPYGYHIAQML